MSNTDKSHIDVSTVSRFVLGAAIFVPGSSVFSVSLSPEKRLEIESPRLSSVSHDVNINKNDKK